MKKELEALKEIREQLIYYKQYAKEVLPTKAQQIDEECEEELDIIETALKDYESRKILLKNIDNDVVVFEPKEVWEEKLKKLKALEIIKRCPKEVIEEVETYSSFEELYEDWGKMAFIKSKEEFELVRKVLGL